MGNNWDIQTDLLVIGSGAAGMTSALTASSAGLATMVVEKAEVFGGTTALSGGVIWVPTNSLMAEADLEDSADSALTYLKHNIGNRVGEAKLASLVRHAPKMLDRMRGEGFLDVAVFEGFPDYNPEAPGGAAAGRSVEPRVFTGRKLGANLKHLRRPSALAPAGVVGTMTELRRLAAIRSNPVELLKAWHVIPRNLWNRLTGANHLANGAALVAWLRKGLDDQGIALHLNTALQELISEDGAIVGAVVNHQGASQRIGTRKGIVIAAGGFENNPAMRKEYFGEDSTTEYTSGSPDNTGDAINAGIAVGAAVDLMDDAWWAPTFMPPGQKPQIVVFERAKPGNIIVNAGGKRFANEADPYNELVKQMQETHRAGPSALPSYLIFDATYRDRYPLGGMLPGITPKRYLDNGFVVRADSLEALATKAGIDPAGLAHTVERFNVMAKAGVDEDFHRGESAFDRFSGDHSVGPNPCLGPIATAPYYVMELYPGDLGTKGGLLTNEHAQVVRSDGTVVSGLYAAGNSSAAVTGNFYPGAGGTIGPAMTYGYIAALHAAGQLETAINTA
jgi:3-oxosteroid 1-dehydrogenase